MDNSEKRDPDLRQFIIRVPTALHKAIFEKCYRDKVSASAAVTRLLMLWTGFKNDPKNDEATISGK
jgi:hypothetical protein